MRHLILIPFAIAVAISSSHVRAQDSGDVVRGIIGFAAGEIERQQRRKQQKRTYRRLHQQFLTSWRACFQDDLTACNQALAYQHIHRNDRSRLETKRRDILAARHNQTERARRIDMERQRPEREQTERRLVQQRAEAERLQRLREQEERRLADLRAFSQNRSACRNHDVSACEQALRSSLASSQDTIQLRRWQTEANTYQQNRVACQAGKRPACTSALASPALVATDRSLLRRWQNEAHPFNRAMASISDLPISTAITGALALILSIALAVVGVRRRTSTKPSAPHDATANEPSLDGTAAFADTFKDDPASKASPASFEEATYPSTTPPPLRDTPGAMAAMELAEAYIEEVREADRPAFDDKVARRAQLNTLALAAKQLARAEEFDPDAELILLIEGEDLAFSINALKAKALILEARSYHDHETKKALPALRQATEVDPTNATAHYLLGIIQATNMNRAGAIEALQCAVDLEPDNLTFRKELNRAESISGVEAAAFKATRAGERVYDTGIATANVGIAIWNVLATFLRVISWPFRAIDGLMRLLRSS